MNRGDTSYGNAPTGMRTQCRLSIGLWMSAKSVGNIHTAFKSATKEQKIICYQTNGSSPPGGCSGLYIYFVIASPIQGPLLFDVIVLVGRVCIFLFIFLNFFLAMTTLNFNFINCFKLCFYIIEIFHIKISI